MLLVGCSPSPLTNRSWPVDHPRPIEVVRIDDRAKRQFPRLAASIESVEVLYYGWLEPANRRLPNRGIVPDLDDQHFRPNPRILLSKVLVGSKQHKPIPKAHLM